MASVTYRLLPLGAGRSIASAPAGEQGGADLASFAGGYAAAFQQVSLGADVLGRVFGAGGAPLGAAFGLASTVAGFQDDPALTGLRGGALVAAWTDATADTVRFRLMSADGTGAADALVEVAGSGARSADVAALADGGFAVAWALDQPGVDDIRLRLYDADGRPRTAGLTLEGGIAVQSIAPAVAGLAGGSVAVAWSAGSSSGGDAAIHLTIRHAAAGAVILADTVLDATGDNRDVQIAALADGGFVLAYTDSGWDDGAGDDGTDITARVFNADGSARSPLLRVNAPSLLAALDHAFLTGGDQFQPALAALSNGGFVVAWTDPFGIAGDLDVQARIFDADGAALSGVETLYGGAGIEMAPSLAGLSDGRLAVAAEVADEGGGHGAGVLTHVFELARTTAGGTGSEALAGDGLRDVLSGGGGDDTLLGYTGDDTLAGGAGNDVLDGGDGLDVAVFDVPSTAATWTRSGAVRTVTTGTEGTDSLRGIDVLRFTDRDVVLSGAARDATGDGKADLLWRSVAGEVATWAMDGAKVLSAGLVATVPMAWTIVGCADTTGDGKADLLWRSPIGEVAAWAMDGGTVTGGGMIGVVPPVWVISGFADATGDGKADLLWRSPIGEVAVWALNGTAPTDLGLTGRAPDTWRIAGFADATGDGKADILWRSVAGEVAVWTLDGAQVVGGGLIGMAPPTWAIAGFADATGDGKADILWRSVAGEVAIWTMDGARVSGSGLIGMAPPTWNTAGFADATGDGKADVVWRSVAGEIAIWAMDGTSVAGGGMIGIVPGEWALIG